MLDIIITIAYRETEDYKNLGQPCEYDCGLNEYEMERQKESHFIYTNVMVSR